MNLYVIGAGRIGATLANMFQASGWAVSGVTTRQLGTAEQIAESLPTAKAFEFIVGEGMMPNLLGALSESSPTTLVFSCTDDVCEQAATQIAALRNDWSGCRVLHVSGGLGLAVLKSFQDKGAEIASLHPCYPVFSPLPSLPRDKGVCYTFRGNESTSDSFRLELEELVEHWQGVFVAPAQLDAEAYHAATVLCAGHLTTLLASAQQLMEHAGLSEKQASELAYSVYSGVLENISGATSAEMSARVTGPFARGDKALIARHRAAIERTAPSLGKLYDVIGVRCQELLKH